jgi:DNA-binding winged helix-turn-helix (wHTH) protein
MAGKSFIFRFGDVEVREREFSLVKAGEVLPVEPKAFRVLLILLRNPQKLMPKEELLNAVWGETAVSENSLTRSIALLRRLLGDEARDPRFIETVATVGYRWVCKVEVVEGIPGNPEAAVEPASGVGAGTPAAGGSSAAPPGTKAGARVLFRSWVIAGAAGLFIVSAAAVWYLRRPLPPPRVTEYVEITHDGALRFWLERTAPGSISRGFHRRRNHRIPLRRWPHQAERLHRSRSLFREEFSWQWTFRPTGRVRWSHPLKKGAPRSLSGAHVWWEAQ